MKKLTSYTSPSSTSITIMFFDFYVLNLLRDFINAKDTVYFYSKQRRIEEMAEMTTDAFFNEVYWALYYSCCREFRHAICEFNGLERYGSHISEPVRKIREYYESAAYSDNYKQTGATFFKILDAYNVSMQEVRNVFNDHKNWSPDYGGKLWAEGCEFLIKLPKNQSEKIIWIDRVLDLYHNNGPLLDKTNFSVLFDDGFDDDDWYSSALDFRAEAPLSALKEKCSRKVRNLVTANQRVFPQALLMK